jgi:hypothetical protein
LPAAQFVHVDVALTTEYVPAPQLVHTAAAVAATDVEYMPAPQFVHV